MHIWNFYFWKWISSDTGTIFPTNRSFWNMFKPWGLLFGGIWYIDLQTTKTSIRVLRKEASDLGSQVANEWATRRPFPDGEGSVYRVHNAYIHNLKTKNVWYFSTKSKSTLHSFQWSSDVQIRSVKLTLIYSTCVISSPNPIFDHLLESSRWDDSNKRSNIGYETNMSPPL